MSDPKYLDLSVNQIQVNVDLTNMSNPQELELGNQLSLR
jgi:uncharacterized protein YkvS